MNLTEQKKYNRIHLLWLALLLLTISCGASEVSEASVTQTTPTAPPAQPVEYGASLSEWEEATQADLEEVGSSEDVNGTASPETAVAATATITATETVNGSVPTKAETDEATATEESSIGSLFTLDDMVYQEIMWDALVPADFTPDAIMAKYEDQLAALEDGSPEASALYTQMQKEFNNAPVNEVLNGTFVRLPGFIAPLEYTDDLITEFLLVPYFGACIHVPPPPANQTVLVKTAKGHGIKSEDAYNPIWIMGRLTAEGVTTELAEAGYYMEEAIIEPYSDSP